MKNAMFLPADLARRLLAAESERDIRQAALDNILGVGIELSTDTSVSFVKAATEAILAADQRYNDCMAEIVALAREKGGYDALTCSPIQANNVQTTGAVTWTIAGKGEKA